MIDHEVKSRAILLHHNVRSRSVEITTHDIITLDAGGYSNSGYTLGAGQVFGAEQKAEIAAILSDEQSSSSLSLISENVLATSPYAVVWWMPGKVRELIVSTGQGKQSFKVKMPGTIAAMCRGNLYVAAFKGNRRPNAETPLYRMPITNLTSDFTFCMGNLQLPREAKVENIPTWTDGIWDSTNTHLGRKPLKGITTSDEYADLLASLDGKSRFPTQKLIACDVTLRDWLNALEARG